MRVYGTYRGDPKSVAFLKFLILIWRKSRKKAPKVSLFLDTQGQNYDNFWVATV